MTDEKDRTRYRLTMTRMQVAVLQEALDMYFRVGMGQLRDVLGHLVPPTLEVDEYCRRRDNAEWALRALRAAAMPDLPPNGSYSISSREISDSNRVAADLYDVVRHHFTKDLWVVGGNEPYCFSTEPLAQMETIEPAE